VKPESVYKYPNKPSNPQYHDTFNYFVKLGMTYSYILSNSRLTQSVILSNSSMTLYAIMSHSHSNPDNPAPRVNLSAYPRHCSTLTHSTFLSRQARHSDIFCQFAAPLCRFSLQNLHFCRQFVLPKRLAHAVPIFTQATFFTPRICDGLEIFGLWTSCAQLFLRFFRLLFKNTRVRLPERARISCQERELRE